MQNCFTYRWYWHRDHLTGGAWQSAAHLWDDPEFYRRRWFRGIFFETEGIDKNATQWGEMALVSDSDGKVTYSTKYDNAWDLAVKTIPHLPELGKKTIDFVKGFIESDLPEVVIESALFNISTLRTETVFRLSDGNLFAYEGSSNSQG